ncbi:MAG: DNA repair exonuclease [candidate division Zixibacteria bacterium]|nr:DNA repair exonuclease [candidate division Zixibacteria bacterium]
MSLAFVHAADFHLGADIRRFGTAAEKLRAAQWDAFTKTLAFAASSGAAFVLICGDLFDSRFPRPEISAKAREILARFPSTPVFILPGTHDYLSDGSILGREDFRAGLSHVVILDGRIKSPLDLPEFNCRLYFSANRSNRSATSPIAGFRREDFDGFHIGAAHGSLRIGGWNTAYDFPINPRDVERSGLDYLALGHWHKYRREQIGSTPVIYSGTPQPTGFSDPETGSVVYVRLERNGSAMVEQVATGMISVVTLAEKIYHPHQVKQLLENAADPNKIIKTVFSYSDNFNEPTEVAAIVTSFAPRFLFMVNQDFPESTGGVERPDSPPAEASALISGFLTELNCLKAADNPERAGLYEKAAEVGTRLIKGDL